MKAIITRYIGEQVSTIEKDMVEYTDFVLQAGERGYGTSFDGKTLYLTNPDGAAQFEIRFEA